MEITIIVILLVIIAFLVKREIANSFTEKSFISIVNHTFRTPLTRIKWMSGLLNPDLTRAEQTEITTNISNSVNRLLEIIDTLTGIKDIYNNSSYTLKEVSLRQIIEEGIAKYHNPINEKKIQLHVPAFSAIPLISIDAKKISFVVHAILENAILYSHDGGAIDIEASMKENNIILSIRDSGIGMTWSERRNIFNRFYRGETAKKMNTEGMGISLYVSKEIIRRHNGNISVQSEGKDKGSNFYVTLPTAKK